MALPLADRGSRRGDAPVEEVIARMTARTRSEPETCGYVWHRCRLDLSVPRAAVKMHQRGVRRGELVLVDP
jgi:hypothetical protein